MWNGLLESTSTLPLLECSIMELEGLKLRPWHCHTSWPSPYTAMTSFMVGHITALPISWAYSISAKQKTGKWLHTWWWCCGIGTVSLPKPLLWSMPVIQVIDSHLALKCVKKRSLYMLSYMTWDTTQAFLMNQWVRQWWCGNIRLSPRIDLKIPSIGQYLSYLQTPTSKYLYTLS